MPKIFVSSSSPHSRNAPVVIAKVIENPEFVSYGIHARPIRIHRNALRIRRASRRASALACARGQSVHRLKEIRDLVVAGAVTYRAGHFEILEIIRLEAEPLRGHEVPRVAYLAIGQESVASGVGGVGRAGHDRSRAGKRLGGCLRAPNVSQVHRSTVRRAQPRGICEDESEILRIDGGVIGDGVVLLEITEELVKGNRSSRQDSEIDSSAIRVRRVAIGLD